MGLEGEGGRWEVGSRQESTEEVNEYSNGVEGGDGDNTAEVSLCGVEEVGEVSGG